MIEKVEMMRFGNRKIRFSKVEEPMTVEAADREAAVSRRPYLEEDGMRMFAPVNMIKHLFSQSIRNDTDNQRISEHLTGCAAIQTPTPGEWGR